MNARDRSRRIATDNDLSRPLATARDVAEHNSGRWLAVVYRFTRAENPAGWIVVRTCPCHDQQRVTRHYDTEAEALSAVGMLLAISATLERRPTCAAK